MTPKITALGQRVLSEAKLPANSGKDAKALALAESLAKNGIFRPITVIPAWTILLDDSRSMTIRDEAEGRSRWEAGLREWDAIAPQLKTWEEQGRLVLRVARFSTAKQGLREFDPKLPPDGTGTAIFDAMSVWSRETRSAPGGLLVISDGVDTESSSASLRVARSVRDRHPESPVSVLALGNPDGTSPDASVRELLVNPYALHRDAISVVVAIAARNLVGRKVHVELRGKLLGGRDEPVVLASVDAQPEDAEGSLRVRFPTVPTPERPGDWQLTASISPLEGDLTDSDNSATALVRLGRFAARVLLLSGPGSVEGSGIEQAMQDVPTIAVRRLQPASEDAVDIDAWNQSVTQSLSEEKFDVVVLCDLRPDGMPDGTQKLLREYIAKGLGLLLCGGERTYSGWSWGDTWLGSVLPVELERFPERLGQEVRFRPTEAGNVGVLRMAPQPQASLEAWSKLELASPARRVRSVKSQARVLATTDPGEAPLLVVHDFLGRGRAAILVLEDTSRWMTSEKKTKETVDLHRRFWQQLLSDLARFEEPKNRVHLERASEVIHVSAKFGLDGIDRAPNLIPDAWLIRPDGQEVRFPLVATLKAIGDFEARVPISAPGEYRIVVRVESEGRFLGQESARIIVPKEDAEFRRPTPDHLMLGEIAYATGGAAYRLGQLQMFLTQVESQLPPPRTRTKEQIEAFVCGVPHDGTPDDFANGLASLLQSQSISSRIIRGKDPADRALVEVPLDDGRSLRIDPVTGHEADGL